MQVTDDNPTMCRTGPSEGAPMRGRGLVIVARLARAWGWHAGPAGGKTVRAEVPFDSA